MFRGALGRRAIKRPIADRRQEKAPHDGGQRGFSERKLGSGGGGASFPVHLRTGAVNNSDSLAMLAAMRRASSRVSSLAAERRPGSSSK